MSYLFPRTLTVAAVLTAVMVMVGSGRSPGAQATDGAGTGPSKPPVATSRTDPFLKLLRDGLDVKVKPATPWEPVGKAVDWEMLRQEAGKAADAAVRQERLAYVEMWKRLAEAHDSGMRSSRMFVFEEKACELFAGTQKPDEQPGHGAPGLPKDRVCRYLLEEDLPAWARSLRVCAAGVLAGEGDRRGMDVLISLIKGGLDISYYPRRSACTEAAFPLWAEATRDGDAQVRLVALGGVAAIGSEKSMAILKGMLKDKDLRVRDAAAMALMNRDVKEAAPVLLEKVNREADGKLPPYNWAPICLRLHQWGIPGVPWEKVEATLNDQVKANVNDYWHAVEIAGWCLAVGRKEIAVPFLKSAMDFGMTNNIGDLATRVTIRVEGLTIAWNAAIVLTSNGCAEGMQLIRKYIETASGPRTWNFSHAGLMALAAFLQREEATREYRQAAMAIAAKAFERRDELFKGYFGNYFARALEALGKMGALVRVEGHLTAVDAIPVPYDQRYGPASNTISRKVSTPPASNARYMIVEIYRAKLRSVEVAARQDKIPLPPEWLAAYAKEQRAAISALMQSPEPDLRRAAETALKDIADGRPVPNAGREDAYAE